MSNMNARDKARLIKAKSTLIEDLQEFLSAMALDAVMFNEHKDEVYKFMSYLNNKTGVNDL